jgi:hypothetical protein
MLVKSREMTGRSPTLPWWLEGGRLKTTENKTTLAALSLKLAGEMGMGGGEGGKECRSRKKCRLLY